MIHRRGAENGEEVGGELSGVVIGAAVEVHRHLGPGLLESAYHACLAHELAGRGVPFQAQVPLPLVYKEVRVDCAYRLDLLVAGWLVVEVKAVERLDRIHEAQLLTYLRLTGCPLGLLINFHSPTLATGIRRLALTRAPSAPSASLR